MKETVQEELKRQFRPEFLNRIDEVIVFHKLTREEIKHIVELLMVRELEEGRWEALGRPGRRLRRS